MRIGLVGYFGWGNYGDELFFEIFHQIFKGHKLIIFHDPIKGAFLPNANELIESVDTIIIGGGDLLMTWYKSWLYWDERFLCKPIFVFGVGVPTWNKSNPDILEYYCKFLSHPNVKMISCRDMESVQWIETHIKPDNKITFSPDMVLALNLPQRHTESQQIGLVLRKQTQFTVDDQEIISDNLKQVYLIALQMGFSMKLILLGSGATLNDDYEVFQTLRFPNLNIVVRDSMTQLNTEIASCNFLLSMKFHGIVAAYKCGVPFISLSGADKFTSFMKMIGSSQNSSNLLDKLLPMKFERLIYEGMDFSKRIELSLAARNGLDELVSSVLALKN